MADTEKPCSRCGEAPRVKPQSKPQYCAECYKIKSAEWYENQAQRGRAQRSPEERQLLRERREAGLCSQCGEHPRAGGKSWCRECQTKMHRERGAAYRARRADQNREYKRIRREYIRVGLAGAKPDVIEILRNAGVPDDDSARAWSIIQSRLRPLYAEGLAALEI